MVCPVGRTPNSVARVSSLSASVLYRKRHCLMASKDTACVEQLVRQLGSGLPSAKGEKREREREKERERERERTRKKNSKTTGQRSRLPIIERG